MAVGSGAIGLVIGWLAAQYWSTKNRVAAGVLISALLFTLILSAGPAAVCAVTAAAGAACRVAWQAQLRHRTGRQ